MRKGISSLCGVVHEKMRSDVRNGDVFIFIGQSRKLQPNEQREFIVQYRVKYPKNRRLTIE